MLKRIVYGAVLAILAFFLLVITSLFLLRWINPPFTAVQAERRVASWFQKAPYTKRYTFVPLTRISPNLQHAVIAAEDARFFIHHGFDWKQIGNAVQEDLEEHRERGASTITQQLVRNLFLSTEHSILRKAIEFSIVPFTEAILSKRRILELYLNVIEWGRGIYGAEAASRYYYSIPAQRLTREQAAELASVLPSPLHRKPGQAKRYTARILEHMHQSGW
ncbi:MAG: monofunctional biosynthetic peptidoglycan transglycosylase [Acidobacteriaceae bacterium]|nr:monofunctional biosynthetic peptidoglycan transglycosylase [Acidobacteriaceae bacterium]